MVFNAMVLGPLFWTQWFLIHGIGCDGFLVHGIGRDGFRSMVFDASACINMYCNIERNIMKNQAGSLGFDFEQF